MIKKYVLIVAAFLVFLSGISFAEQQFGVLKVIANQDTARIFIDGNFEGTGTVSRDKIIIGNHLVQVKDEDKNVLFEEMVSVREGEQTTVVVKTPASVKEEIEATPLITEPAPELSSVSSSQPYSQIRNIFGIDGTYGTWTVNVNVAGYSGSGQSSEPVKELGVHLKSIYENIYCESSYHYIFPISGAVTNIGSFIGLDIGGQNDFLSGGLGVNYFFPTQPSGFTTITGGLGGQAFLGLRVASVTIGTKYLLLNGSGTYAGYKVNASYSQLLLYVSADFGN